MLQIRPVIEVTAFPGTAPWPVADLPAWSWLPLDGARTEGEVAFFVAAVAASDTLDELLASDGDRIVVGGLQIHDTVTGATVSPGCCCGLEDWRTWQDLCTGGTGRWLGHDPTPTVEHRGDLVRLWQDEQRRGPFVDVAPAVLPGLLEHVRHDLTAFLALTSRWAAAHGDALTAVLDSSFAMTAPLELPCDTGTSARPA
ncbi:hypothetical protein AB0G04_10960 [Actinoplanes sp. NPDC023801]|uniref:hypothetical protein n=1 Tax=Actinoplanes sp. NPDC023801 TaxID=3154595 RepID=UPI0033DC3C5C